MGDRDELAQSDIDAVHLRAVGALRAREFEAADALFREALAGAPHAGAMHSNYSVLLRERGLLVESLAAAEQAVACAPDLAGAWYNRGITLAELGRFPEALESYAQVLRIDPGYAEGWFNRGSVLFRLHRTEEACTSYAQAVALRPTSALFQHHLGLALEAAGETQQAHACFAQAVTLDPDSAPAWFSLGMLQLHRGRLEDSSKAFARALAEGHPDPDRVKFFLAAAEGKAPPPAPPEHYLKELFDHYAPRFEQHLVGVLGYSAPEVLYRLLRGRLGTGLEIIDLGCGTGLLGSLLRPHAARLIGVDLAPAMLDLAREKHLYDELVLAELRAYLGARSAPCDLVVATDVFIYVGELREVFREVTRLLRPGGLFAFSVEQHAGEGFALLGTARYAHSYAYCKALGEGCGLQLRTVESRAIRSHQNSEIEGYYLVFERL